MRMLLFGEIIRDVELRVVGDATFDAAKSVFGARLNFAIESTGWEIASSISVKK